MEIVTDIDSLRQISQTIQDNKEISTQKAKDLFQIMPDYALGLASCQIGHLERMFITRLSFGTFAFVNPVVKKYSKEMFPSEEGCLSLPDITRCVSRHCNVVVEADYIYDLINDTYVHGEIKCKDKDSAIFQHEFDHLDGILIIDKPEVPSRLDRVIQRQKDREQRILDNRQNKKSKLTKKQTFSAKKMKEIKRSLNKELSKLQKANPIEEKEV